MFSPFLALMTMSTVLAPFIANVNSCPHSATDPRPSELAQLEIPLEAQWLLDHRHISQELPKEADVNPSCLWRWQKAEGIEVHKEQQLELKELDAQDTQILR